MTSTIWAAVIDEGEVLGMGIPRCESKFTG